MKTKFAFALLIVAFAFCFSPSASAAPLTLNDPGVVGILNGKTGDSSPAVETAFAQHLLDMIANSTDLVFSPGTGYTTSTTEYSGTLIYGGKDQTTGAHIVPAGYEYAFAKYDGQNGGYVLFHIPTWGSTDIPEFSYSVWGANAGQYQISHFLYFTEFQEDTPDGGSMVMMLGMALLGLGGVRRMLK